MVKRFKTEISTTLTSPKETEKLGTALAKEFCGGEVLLLSGTLGAGKTTLVKGLAKGLGVKQTITSPTYVLMKVYPVKHGRIRQFVHVDCYRLPVVPARSRKSGGPNISGSELAALGITDYLDRSDTIVAIEWSEKLPYVPPDAIQIDIAQTKKTNERLITVY